MMNHYSHNFVRAATSRPGTEGDRQLKRMTMMLILQLKIPQCLLLLQWLLLNTPLPAWADEQPCPPAVKIDNYFDLEEIAINNSSVNREELFRVFFSPNLPSPKSVKVYYYYQVDNCSEPQPYRIAEGSCGNNETWYWMSSAVYFIIDPLVLDRHALHILSWLPPFPEQLQPELKLTIPPIAANKAFNLLQQFTMTLRVYATGSRVRNDLGFVRRHCNGLIQSTMRNNELTMDHISMSLLILLGVGICIIAALLFVISAVVLRKHLPAMVKRSHQASYNHYGLFWGAASVSWLVNGLLMVIHTFNLKEFLANYIPIRVAVFAVEITIILLAFFCNLVLALVLTVGNSFNTPSLLLCLVAPLCCGNDQKARYLLTALSLWTILVAMHFLVAHSFFVFLALLASPEEVILKAILYVFALFCSTHLLAVLFTICKIKRNAHNSTVKRVVEAVGNGLAFTLLMAGSMCIGFLVTAAGQLETFSPNLGSTLSTLSRFMSPILLSLVGWSLKSLSTKWLKHIQTSVPVDTPLEELEPVIKPAKRRQSYSSRIADLVSPLVVITHRRWGDGERESPERRPIQHNEYSQV